MKADSSTSSILLYALYPGMIEENALFQQLSETITDYFLLYSLLFSSESYDETASKCSRSGLEARGRFISEDPIRDGLLWYAYANNNPLKYVDPTGLYTKPITSYQYQNVGVNENAQIGSERTGRVRSDRRYHTNRLGDEGCLFVGAMNVVNSIRREKQFQSGYYPNWESNNAPGIAAASMSSSDRYFNIFGANNDFVDGGLEKDFATGPGHIQKLIKDSTGENYYVERVSGSTDSTVEDLLRELVELQEYGVYIIAKVGDHFVNVNGLTENEKTGRTNLDDQNPWSYKENRPEYSIDEVDAFYLIEEEQQHEERTREQEEETYSWDYY